MGKFAIKIVGLETAFLPPLASSFISRESYLDKLRSSTVKDVDQDYPTVSKIRHEPSQSISHQDGQSLMGKFEMFHSIQINAAGNLHPSAKRYLTAEL